MRRPLLRALLLAVGTIAVSGCFLASECTDTSSRLTVAVRDVRTGEPIDGADVVIVEGTYRDTLSSVGQPAGSYVGTQRTGTYALTVTAPRYQTSARTVAVTMNDCQWRGWFVTVDLAPQ